MDERGGWNGLICLQSTRGSADTGKEADRQRVDTGNRLYLIWREQFDWPFCLWTSECDRRRKIKIKIQVYGESERACEWELKAHEATENQGEVKWRWRYGGDSSCQAHQYIVKLLRLSLWAVLVLWWPRKDIFFSGWTLEGNDLWDRDKMDATSSWWAMKVRSHLLGKISKGVTDRLSQAVHLSVSNF